MYDWSRNSWAPATKHVIRFYSSEQINFHLHELSMLTKMCRTTHEKPEISIVIALVCVCVCFSKSGIKSILNHFLERRVHQSNKLWKEQEMDLCSPIETLLARQTCMGRSTTEPNQRLHMFTMFFIVNFVILEVMRMRRQHDCCW